MIKNILQTDKRLLNVIQKYGCYFLCFAQASPIVFEGDEGCHKLNGIWSKAEELGYISSDLNHDGDYDDSGEAEIQDATSLAQKFFNLKVKYDNMHHDATETIPPNVKLIFGQFWWKSGHFTQINRKKSVIYDSFGKSNTVKNGKLKSMRWFYAD